MQRDKALMQNAARFALMRNGGGLRRSTIIRTKSAALVRKDAAFCISSFGALHFQFVWRAAFSVRALILFFPHDTLMRELNRP